MGNSINNKLSKLYTGSDIYVRLYADTRAKLLKLDYYSQFLPTNGLLIDIGCGYGVVANYLSLRFPDIQILGIDLDSKRINDALKTVGKRKNITFLLKDAKEWDLPRCTGVLMTDFLHHVSSQDQELILRQVFNRLENDGVLVISEVDPTARPFYRYWASYLSDRALYPLSRSYFRKPHDWQNTLSHIGFSVKAIKIHSYLFAGIVYICQK